MLAKCIKDLIFNGETRHAFTCGNTYELKQEDGEYFTTNDLGEKHWLPEKEDDDNFSQNILE